MNYRKLGRWGLKVSEVSLGGWLTQGRTLDDQTTEAIVRRAFELGVNFFDSADVYNLGEAEKALGRAIQGIRREDLVVATKCYFPMSEAPNDRGLSRKHIVESLNASLKRLQLDYVDILQCHRFDATTPVEETVRAMHDLIRQGKALYWGVSQWKAHQIVDAVHVARELGCAPPISDQPIYNMLERGIESTVIPACEQCGLGIVVFSPLAQGVLTGKYLPGQAAPEGSRGADEKSNTFMDELQQPAVLERVQNLRVLAKSHGCELPEFALAWCLRQRQVSAVIVGATKVEQLEQNVKASDLELPDEAWQQADEILEGK